ncbi:MAG: DUF2791 family P-loop domain-containing protein [Spirochaetaceae bacterium]|nr:DUF2791 family P-loop domain-containing protein [Spirochaetaceae bacterium]
MIDAGSEVEHIEFGIGNVVTVFGDVATVEFFGERIDVAISELQTRVGSAKPNLPPQKEQSVSDIEFRKTFEAVNLGVVPTDPTRLVKLTIGGQKLDAELSALLSRAAVRGACRTYLGYYGSGKSHHLRVVRSVALRDGWVTACLELDPKAADPAKPSTVYQALIASLEFPAREDGSQSIDFFDLVKEIRQNWGIVSELPYVKRSPWFRHGLRALLYLSHRRDDPDYVAAVNWLAGQVKQIRAIRSLSWRAGYRQKIPSLPQVKDTGVVYAYNLVVLHHILRELGYKGLAIVVDEAEHVRTYSVNRYVRASNFLDVLARCAQPPKLHLADPHDDYGDLGLPSFWKEGPHFVLFVGLTEAESNDRPASSGNVSLSLLVQEGSDVVQLSPPPEAAYGRWCEDFLAACAEHLGPKVHVLTDTQVSTQIAGILRANFAQATGDDRLLRNWTKLASLGPAVLLSHERQFEPDELAEAISRAAVEVSGEVLPWDD